MLIEEGRSLLEGHERRLCRPGVNYYPVGDGQLVAQKRSHGIFSLRPVVVPHLDESNSLRATRIPLLSMVESTLAPGFRMPIRAVALDGHLQVGDVDVDLADTWKRPHIALDDR